MNFNLSVYNVRVTFYFLREILNSFFIQTVLQAKGVFLTEFVSLKTRYLEYLCVLLVLSCLHKINVLARKN